MHIRTSDQPALRLGFGDYSCNWGTHIAGLYETPEERDQIIFGFLKEGCHSGDLNLYCPVERSRDSFIKDFSTQCPHCAGKLNDPDCFSIDSAKSLYYPDGTFSPEAMDIGLNRFFETSQRKGPRNIRGTAEMIWALEAVPGVEHLMVYESRLNYFIPDKPWISICLYNISKFDGKTIMQVLETHPFTISGGILMQNPYFKNPDEWLAENAPQFLPDRK